MSHIEPSEMVLSDAIYVANVVFESVKCGLPTRILQEYSILDKEL